MQPGTKDATGTIHIFRAIRMTSCGQCRSQFREKETPFMLLSAGKADGGWYAGWVADTCRRCEWGCKCPAGRGWTLRNDGTTNMKRMAWLYDYHKLCVARAWRSWRRARRCVPIVHQFHRLVWFLSLFACCFTAPAVRCVRLQHYGITHRKEHTVMMPRPREQGAPNGAPGWRVIKILVLLSS